MDNINHLFKEKAARLEGLLVEKIFLDQLIKPSFGKNFSSGWWFVKDKGKYKVIKLCLSGLLLNETDHELMALFQQSGEVKQLSVVVYDEAARCFKYCAVPEAGRGSIADIWDKNARVLPVHSPSEVHEEDPHQQKRTLQAIAELSIAGHVWNTAKERFFASYCLGEKYAWDLDYYVKYRGKIIAFEVKQKFPIRHSSSFGINTGLAMLFEFQERLGIICYHIILTKPVWNMNFEAIRLLKEEKYSARSLWIGARLTAAHFSKRTFSSPGHTSLYKKNTLKYHEVPVRDFRILKHFKDVYHTQSLLSFLNGFSVKIKNVDDIPEISEGTAGSASSVNDMI